MSMRESLRRGKLISSLHEQVHVVDAQRIEFGVRPLDIEQQPPKRHKGPSISTISTVIKSHRETRSYISTPFPSSNL